MFAQLSAAPRAKSGPVWVRWVVEAGEMPPRVAFAISVAVGNAVIRNTLRRRMRAILRSLDLPSGQYLFGVTPAAAGMSASELRRLLEKLVLRMGGTAS